MKLFWVVGLGGFLGATLRYLLAGWAQEASRTLAFPFGTLAVNLVGCFSIGMLSWLLETRGGFSPEVRVFLFAGLLGGLTTFSTFGLDTLVLLRAGQTGLALGNVALNNVLGLGLVWGGYLLGGRLLG